MDRDKYRRLFIDEARENLRSLSNDLVVLEKLQGSGDDSSARRRAEVMDSAFRTAHSLKGMAAAMGFLPFAELAHHLEDLADIARQGQRLSSEAFDLLLEAADRLDAMVNLVVDGKDESLDAGDLPARVAAEVKTLRGAVAPEGAGAPPAPAGAPTSFRQGDEALLVVRVHIADDAPLPQVRAFLVHRTLSAMAGWKSTEPAPDTIKTSPLPGRALFLRFDRSVSDEAAILAAARAAQSVDDVSVVREAPVAAVPAPRVEEGTDPARPAEAEDRTVRVRTAILDEFIDSVGELLLTRSRLRALATRTEAPELLDLVDEVERLTRDLHERVVAARMTPLSFITERLPRVVRDLARRASKPVELVMEGTEIELDRAILDELSTPLIHMIRNAVDHGHEGGAARAARGKPAHMRLSLRASRDRDQVLVELEDDGGGIDAAAVRARAVQRGLVTAAAADAMTDPQALELVCLPGFSTAEAVSETSGRGVGMDVVKASLERMGGVLRIDSKVGKGTRFTLQLPLTVAIIQVLVVEAGAFDGQRDQRDAYAIPVNRVEHAAVLDPQHVTFAHGRAFFANEGELVPLYDLSTELGFPGWPLDRAGTIILVGRGQELAALRVDAVLGQEEVVAKPLGRPLSQFGYLSGATLLADGRAAFILEPHRLIGLQRAHKGT
jgi:two-component system chemotaxis sensor kinase CheA